jgi:hypothetical protein
MKFVSGLFLSAGVLAAVLAVAPARADDPAPAPACEVPDYLLTSDNALPKTAEAIKVNKSLNILVIGSRSSTINATATSAEAIAYPGQMLIALREKLPEVKVEVSVEIQAKKTAEEVLPSLSKLMQDKKPTLVVWQTGTVDAVRSIDTEEFRMAVDEGVVAVREAGAEIVLMNPQYSPRTETMISVAPYLDNLRVVAQQHDVPLFDRFSIMQGWSESGEFDLFSTVHSAELATRVHHCLGRALSQFILEAAHPLPVQEN